MEVCGLDMCEEWPRPLKFIEGLATDWRAYLSLPPQSFWYTFSFQPLFYIYPSEFLKNIYFSNVLC